MSYLEDLTTVVDVGTRPYYAPAEWKTFEFRFHDFKNLSTKQGHASKKVGWMGQDWWLTLYPGTGKGFGGRRVGKKGMVSIFLNQSLNTSVGLVRFAYTMKIKDWDGDVITSSHAGPVQWHAAIKRSRVIGDAEHILVDGTFVVEINLVKVERGPSFKLLPAKPFIPSNASSAKMEALYFGREEYADVTFVFSAKDEEKGEGASDCVAHRVVLEACAPDFAELIKPHLEESTQVLINNVEQDVFQLLIQYIYGVEIKVYEWELHSKDLLDAADCYNLPGLKLEAEYWYAKFNEITAGNAVDLLSYADSKSCAWLKESIIDFFLKNKEAVNVSFDEIPGTLASMLLRYMTMAINMGKDEDYDTEENMNISVLRGKLARRGLEVDGSREMLVKRLKDFNEKERDTSDDSGEEDSDDEESSTGGTSVGDEASTSTDAEFGRELEQP